MPTIPRCLPNPGFTRHWWCERIFLYCSSSIPELKIEGTQGSRASLWTEMNALQCKWLCCKHTHLMLVNYFFPLGAVMWRGLKLSVVPVILFIYPPMHSLKSWYSPPVSCCNKAISLPQKANQTWTDLGVSHIGVLFTSIVTLYVWLAPFLHVVSERTEAGALCCLWTFWKGSSSIYKVLKIHCWGCKDV